ncbi:hypothetical protein [Beggiatoa leptomitoformis]|nr:hypothetical protein [Beggiatoa leptomitoformis]
MVIRWVASTQGLDALTDSRKVIGIAFGNRDAEASIMRLTNSVG